MKIGILRETRRWKDRRAAITPQVAKTIMDTWPEVKIVAQPSEVRIFQEQEYIAAGVEMVEDLSDCDLLIGVKEVSEEAFIPGKTYFMFAHVVKEQEHNRSFFKDMAVKKITLLDYEYFTGKNGLRLVAFGHWAGVVGAYYAIMAIMKSYLNTDIPHPTSFYDVDEMVNFLKAFKIPPVKLVITGDGRVGQGAAFILREHGIKEVAKEVFLNETFTEPVFCMLPFTDYVKPKPASQVLLEEFFTHPSEFESTFEAFTKAAHVYLPCHYWDPNSPVFFTKEDMQKEDFHIKIVADISCDVPGPVPATIRTSTHEEPFYDLNPNEMKEETAFSGLDNILVTAVDNLPTALPINASNTFAEALLKHVIPAFFNGDAQGVLHRATILQDGKLTEKYSYLEGFLKG